MLTRLSLSLTAVSMVFFFALPTLARPVTVEQGENLTEQAEIWILDVRSKEEYKSGHIRRAHQIPVQELKSRTSELPSDKATGIFVYCKSGRRSAQAEKLLNELGYSRVYHLEGGLDAWREIGKPIIK